MRIKFTRYKVKRTCEKEYSDFHSYKNWLQKDFNHRCAYCDLLDSWIEPLPFQIDHFIPQKAFKAENQYDLETKYTNLMYACPKCNRAKSDAFSGKISKGKIENLLFYNPDTDDMNAHFYRDESGRILSDEAKGKDIIKSLKLYRPSKQMAWYLDELEDARIKLESLMNSETDSRRKYSLTIAYNSLTAEMYIKDRYFRHSY